MDYVSEDRIVGAAECVLRRSHNLTAREAVIAMVRGCGVELSQLTTIEDDEPPPTERAPMTYEPNAETEE